jgi:hypothetical protein
MKRKIDEGVLIDTDTLSLIQWFTQPADGGHIPWVRIERTGGLHEIHVKAGEAVPTLKEAERLAVARAEQMIAASMAAPAESTQPVQDQPRRAPQTSQPPA